MNSDKRITTEMATPDADLFGAAVTAFGLCHQAFGVLVTAKSFSEDADPSRCELGWQQIHLDKSGAATGV
jgi:hypothetical protein